MLLIQTTVFITGNGLREGEREGGVGRKREIEKRGPGRERG